jgi:uncharacterized protein (TIGR03437 family)
MQLTCLALAFLSALPALAQPVNVAGRLADLNYIATQLPSLDPYFFAHLDPGQFQIAVQNLNARVSTATDAEFDVGLAQLVAMSGDTHTELYLNIPAFPLQFRWLDDGIFVTATAAEYSQALGARLVAVAGMPIDQVVQRLATAISHENDQRVRYMAAVYLTSQLVLEGLDIVPAAPTTDFTFQTLAGDEFTLQVSAELAPVTTAAAPDWSQGAIPDYFQSRDQNFWFTYSAANRLLYFKYNACSNPSNGPTFATFATSLLNAMDSNTVDTLVFDFRGNGGGSNMLWQPLLDGFQQRLPRLLSNPNFRVYVAFDKASFSAAVDNPMKLKSPALLPGVDLSAVVRTIGEPAGEAPAMNGNVLPFTLPSSRLMGWYATSTFPRPSWIPDGPELLPDIAVGVHSTDYFARFDPVMAAILARSGNAPAAPSGNAITVNAASFRLEQGLVPGSFASTFGRFSTPPDEVLVSGTPGQIVYTSRLQLNFVVPGSVAPGRAVISVRAAGQELASGEGTIDADGPGIFILQPGDPSQPGAVENEDYSINAGSNPAAKGSVVRIFATGHGAAAGTVQVFFGDTQAQVVYSGIPEPGLWRIDAVVPQGVSGPTPMFLVSGNVASNGVSVWVR